MFNLGGALLSRVGYLGASTGSGIGAGAGAGAGSGAGTGACSGTGTAAGAGEVGTPAGSVCLEGERILSSRILSSWNGTEAGFAGLIITCSYGVMPRRNLRLRKDNLLDPSVLITY